ENNKLREQNKDLSETLSRANEFIKDRKKDLDNALNVIKVIREIFEKLEQVLGRNKYQHLMNDVSRDNGRMIKTIQMFDKQIHPEEYQEKEQKNNQNHGRGMSR
ncbi:plasmid recombination enzyme, partial [Staphylococcus haemolyticus]|nr:plasmid recombination enzyme [Staphylococcus haemolyticus]